MTTATQIPQMSVAEVSIEFPNALKIFNKYKIDYCCGGQRSFEEACNAAKISSELVWEAINKNGKEAGSAINFKNWSPSLLVDYILDQHHNYVREAIPLLDVLFDKVCSAHGDNHPELFEIKNSFQLLSEELMQHMDKEERILFPAIKMMRDSSTEFPFAQPITVMKDEHESAGNLIKEIRTLTSNYTVPKDVCTTYRMMFTKLEAFDNDLMQHIHLENNILFEKVNNPDISNSWS